jgi:signal transduction histidine kinase
MIHRISLQTRLLAIAAATIVITLGLTSWTIKNSVAGTIGVTLNAKMDAQINAFSAASSRDPSAFPNRSAFLVEFDAPRPQWGWRVARADRAFQGGVSFGAITRTPDNDDHQGIVSGSATAASGQSLHIRSRTRNGEQVEVAAPAEIVTVPIRQYARTTYLSVGMLAVALVLISWLQFRATLGPLRALRDGLARIRAGERQTLPEEQPAELLPLALEMNALIAQNEADLANARRHVANLAHGLKTPLATLALRQVRDNASTEARAIVADLDQRIEHHLGRARAAASGSGGGAHANVFDVANQLSKAMIHLHRERALTVALRVPRNCVAAVDRQDLDEMLGNLLDNACRHANEAVRLTCTRDGSRLLMRVEDDGPGIAAEQITAAFRAGTRLDEAGRGYGFGVSICLELAELYGGTLRLDRSAELGGLEAKLAVPARV